MNYLRKLTRKIVITIGVFAGILCVLSVMTLESKGKAGWIAIGTFFASGIILALIVDLLN